MNEHTKEPWKVSEKEHDVVCIFSESAKNMVVHAGTDGYISEDDARRIVACVNACAGVSDDMLGKINSTGGVSAMLARNVQRAVDDALATEQRDKLLAALNRAADLLVNAEIPAAEFLSLIAEIEAAK